MVAAVTEAITVKMSSSIQIFDEPRAASGRSDADSLSTSWTDVMDAASLCQNSEVAILTPQILDLKKQWEEINLYGE
jgi:hypothetical protein